MTEFLLDLIPICLNGLFCFCLGACYGKNGGRLGKTRAHAKVFLNGDVALHVPTIEDDLRIAEGIFLHLEAEGFDVSGAKEQLAKSLLEGKRKEKPC